MCVPLMFGASFFCLGHFVELSFLLYYKLCVSWMSDSTLCIIQELLVCVSVYTHTQHPSLHLSHSHTHPSHTPITHPSLHHTHTHTHHTHPSHTHTHPSHTPITHTHTHTHTPITHTHHTHPSHTPITHTHHTHPSHTPITHTHHTHPSHTPITHTHHTSISPSHTPITHTHTPITHPSLHHTHPSHTHTHPSHIHLSITHTHTHHTHAPSPAIFLVDSQRTVYVWLGWWPQECRDWSIMRETNITTGSAHARWLRDKKLALETAQLYAKGEFVEFVQWNLSLSLSL